MKSFFYPLVDNPFSSKDIIAGTKVLKTRQLTLSKITKNFEKNFTKLHNLLVYQIEKLKTFQ